MTDEYLSHVLRAIRQNESPSVFQEACGLAGSRIGFTPSYSSLSSKINGLSRSQREQLVAKIQREVGSDSVEEFDKWVRLAGHLAILIYYIIQIILLLS